MISKMIKNFCDTPEQIENYDKAVADETQTWECHHRLELDDNGNRKYTVVQLKELGLYYHRPPEELIFLTRVDHHVLHMSGDEREKISRVQKKSWKKPKRKRMHTMIFERRRQEGKTLTGIEQLRSDQDYRDYQRLQHRIWYDKNRERWNRYNYKNRLSKMTFQEILGVRNKHVNGILIARETGNEEKVQKLERFISLIDEYLEEKRGK